MSEKEVIEVVCGYDEKNVDCPACCLFKNVGCILLYRNKIEDINKGDKITVTIERCGK